MPKLTTKIITTLGPSSFNSKTINSFKKLGVFLYRINLSHTSKDQLKSKIKFLRRLKVKNICIDTEGAQIRTTKIKKKIYLKSGTKLKIFIGNKYSSKRVVYLYPEFNLLSSKVGGKISIGFDDLVMKIIKVDKLKSHISVEVINPGLLDSNKGVHFDNHISLNSLTKKDLDCIKIAVKNKINFFALSFANKGDDVSNLRKLIPYKSFIVSKIETKNAIKNLSRICAESDALLIDRGDLSRYVDLSRIPYAQHYIVKEGHKKRKPVYVATNLLENMIKFSSPTRAECNDIYNALNQKVDGLVLAAESAIGNDPVKCVKFLKNSINVFNLFNKNNNVKKFITK